MTDNLLKAVVDAISESDNEIGGQIITRLRDLHKYGGNDASLSAGTPTQITNSEDIFNSTSVDRMIDILEKDTQTGNEGSYLVDTVVDSKNATLKKIDGTTPSFSTESEVVWRFADLLVETTFDFPQRDQEMQLWVGNQEKKVPYCNVDQTPGSQKFLGLGNHVGNNYGIIDTSASDRINAVKENTFSSSDIGKTFWVIPTIPPNGNEGPRIITSVPDDKTAVFVGSAFVADEENVIWRKKTYIDDGYLTMQHRVNSEIIDASRSYSALDKLKRSFLVNYATEEELDQVGHNWAVIRPKIFGDETHRRFIKARAFLPTQTVYSLEIILRAIYPSGGWEIYEDLSPENYQGNNNKVFVFLPELILGAVFEGRSFILACEEAAIPTGANTVELPSGVNVESIVSLKPALTGSLYNCEMDVLPSAEPSYYAFTYIDEGEATEGNIFSVSSSILAQTVNTGTPNGGRYERLPFSATKMFSPYNPILEISVWWRSDTITLVNDYPWHLMFQIDPWQAWLEWDDSGNFRLTDETASSTIASLSSGPDTADGEWHFVRIRYDGKNVDCFWDSTNLFGTIPKSDLLAYASTATVGFGFKNRSSNQTWDVEWDRMKVYANDNYDYNNLNGIDGQLSGSTLSSASNPFISADDTRHVRIWSDKNKNDGLWEATYVGAGSLTLDGIERLGATVSTSDGDNFITLDEPWFNILKEKTKDITISGSTLGNNSTREILEVITQYKVRVDGSDFVSESELTWKLEASFDAESNVMFAVIDTSSFAGDVITVRESFAGSYPIDIKYSTILSMQVLKNEFIRNEGFGGSAGNVYYPFYLTDIDMSIQKIIEDITAAGVIPYFERSY